MSAAVPGIAAAPAPGSSPVSAAPSPSPSPSLWDVLGASRARLAPDVRFAARPPRRGAPAETIVRNEVDGAHVRIDARLAALLHRLDGVATVAEHLERLERPVGGAAGRTPVDDEPSGRGAGPCAAHDLEALATALATLERAGILATGLPGADARAWRTHLAHRAGLRRRWTNPLAVRVPLCDPDPWIERAVPVLRRVPRGAAAFAAAVLACAALATVIVRAEDLAAALAALAGAPARWWTVLATWPVLKLVHEAGHAFAVRAHGGRVREAGIALLVLMPVPWVDASDASLFPTRRARMAVGAAGTLAELALAALALLAWSALEPGTARDLAFALALAGSVSAVLFNANPLLRFDGYHVLQDALDVPNLGPRAAAWWRARLRHRLFGLRESTARTGAARDAREARTLALYGAAAWAWRYVVVFGIALWLLETLPVAGAVLAGFAVWPLLVRPVLRATRWLAAAPELAGTRGRALAIAAAAVALPTLAIGVVPLPSSTRTEGVVWAGDGAELLATEAGELVGFAVAPGARVARGEVVARLDAPGLALDGERALARIEALEAARGAARRTDPVEVRALDAEIDAERRRAATLRARLRGLEVRAGRAGRFVPRAGDVVPGRRVPRGRTLGHIVSDGTDAGPFVVRVAVRERDVGRLDEGVREARVRLAEAPGESMAANVRRVTPAADHTLPSASLAGAGGMAVAGAEDELRTLEPVFHVELALPDGARVAGLGGRAYVTLVHPAETLARRWARALRQLFLERIAA